MPPDLGKMLSFLAPISYLLAITYYSIRFYDRRKQKKSSRIPVTTTAIQRRNILKIEQKEPSNRPPAILSILLIIGFLLLLILGASGIYSWIAGKVKFVFDIYTLFLLLVFVVLPLYILVDNFIIQPRFYRIGKSSVAKEAKVIYHSDADAAFNICRAILDSMTATIINAKKPKMLKAKFGKSIITVKVRRLKGSNVSIHVLSDSQWLTVKLDMGANQRNIDNFLQELNKH